jgi:cytochrome c-type biogenesis protein
LNPIQLSFAFSAGVAAALNPCGVAILPSYISYLLTRKSEGNNCSVLSKQTLGGLAAGLTMTAGFFSIFGIFGLLFSLFGRSVIAAVSPWFSLAVGIILLGLGLTTFTGREIFQINLTKLSTRLEQKGGKGCLKPFYFYGLGYALASLGCTFPIFIMVISQALVPGDYLSSVLIFFSYAAGMGVIVTGISIATRFLREGLSRWLNKLLPYVREISGVIIIAAGAYLIYYSLF